LSLLSGSKLIEGEIKKDHSCWKKVEEIINDVSWVRFVDVISPPIDLDEYEIEQPFERYMEVSFWLYLW